MMGIHCAGGSAGDFISHRAPALAAQGRAGGQRDGFSPACATDMPRGPAKVAQHLLSLLMPLNLKGGF